MLKLQQLHATKTVSLGFVYNAISPAARTKLDGNILQAILWEVVDATLQQLRLQFFANLEAFWDARSIYQAQLEAQQVELPARNSLHCRACHTLMFLQCACAAELQVDLIAPSRMVLCGMQHRAQLLSLKTPEAFMSVAAPAKPRFKLLQSPQELKAMLVRCHEVSENYALLNAVTNGLQCEATQGVHSGSKCTYSIETKTKF